MSWPRVFLKVRRALFETSWADCMEGVKRYAKYCQEAGIEGSAFVIAPARFFEDEIYLEDLTFLPTEDPKVAEHKRKESERWARALEAASRLGVGGSVAGAEGLRPMQGECVAAFETRIRLAQDGIGRGHGGRGGNNEGARAGGGELSNRITSLSERMKINARGNT